jgi:hypothetical protein
MMIIKNKGLCWTCHEHKLSCIHIPKCASTTIKHSLNYVADDFHKLPSEYFTFTVLRNPYERFFSAYAEALRRSEAKDILPFPDSASSINRAIDLLEGGVYEPHFVPQNKLLTKNDGTTLNINKYIWFDTFERDVMTMYGNMGMRDYTISIMNTNDNSVKDCVRDIVINSGQLKDRIASVYKADFDLINSVFAGRYKLRL